MPNTMPPPTRIAAVTGANKGIGLAIVRQLALRYPSSTLNNGPLLIYLTARNEQRGQDALSSLQSDSQLKSAKALSSHGGLSDFKYLPLDIDDQSSIKGFADKLKAEHPDGIDVLVNNAGIAMNGFDADVVKKTLHCNYYGTLDASQQLLPHIKDGGRIVNVASWAGKLGVKYSDEIRQRFLKAKKTEEITALMEEFTNAVEQGEYEGRWPGAAYAVSKAGVIGMTRTMAQEAGDRVTINACCPGYVNTDMTKGRGSKSVDEGAKTPTMLALGELGEDKSGTFWMNEKDVSHRWGGD